MRATVREPRMEPAEPVLACLRLRLLRVRKHYVCAGVQRADELGLRRTRRLHTDGWLRHPPVKHSSVRRFKVFI